MHSEVIAGDPDGLPLEFLVRAEKYFEFLEPVTIELRLRNLLYDIAIPIDARLQPEHGNVRILIETSDRSVHAFHPPTCELGDTYLLTLEPAGSTPGQDRYSEQVPLSFGGSGFCFDCPGTYRIRAMYRGLGNSVIASNIHQLRVGAPESREVDRLAQSYFDNEVGLSLVFGGSRSAFLAKGMNVLREVCDAFKTTDKAIKTSAIVAKVASAPFYHLDQKNKLITASLSDKDYKDALSLTTPGREKYDKTKEASLNFADVELSELRYNLHKQLGNEKDAAAEKQSLLKRLAKRKVNSPVVERISQRLT